MSMSLDCFCKLFEISAANTYDTSLVLVTLGLLGSGLLLVLAAAAKKTPRQ